jgi:dTDP-4-amino-4,6-dideoxygalactose transaminase
MTLRRQVPVWSPLDAGALAAGFRPSQNAIPRITERINTEYQPLSLLLTSSGTGALALGFLASAKPGRRPRVALPAWGCYDLMTAADAADALVLLYDLDPLLLAPESASLTRVLDQKPDALVVAHWHGTPVELGPILATARTAGTLLIDDAAQGVAACTVDGRPVGTGGDFGVLSFGRGKGRTGGSGGALLASTREAESRLSTLTDRLRPAGSSLVSYALLWTQYWLGRPSLYWLPASIPWFKLGETVYRDPPELTRLSRRAAAVLDSTWDLAENEAGLRRVNAEKWDRTLAGAKGIQPVPLPRTGVPGWLRYPILADEATRSRLQGDRARRHGVMPGYPRLLAELPVKPGRIELDGSRFAGAAKLATSLFTLPTHRWVTDADVEGVFGLLRG